MPLFAKNEDSIFCLDFTRHQPDEFNPLELTLPALVYQKGNKTENITDYIFDAESLSEISHGRLVNDMESFAEGLLAAGFVSGDHILICANNISTVLSLALGISRAGLVFGLASPNLKSSEQLAYLLASGDFRGVVLFSAEEKNADSLYHLIREACPELLSSTAGKLKSAKLPKLNHVILANEDHRHAGTYTLSEIFSTSKKVALPDYMQWNCHRMAAIGFTMGSTGLAKAVAMTHYQLINGSRVAIDAIGLPPHSKLACALPLFRLPVFGVVVLAPLLVEGAKVIFPEPSPVPRRLFATIAKHACSTVVSNAAALRLGLRTFYTHKLVLPSVTTAILLGERVTGELLTGLDRVMPNAKRIAVGLLNTEVGICLLSDNTTNLIKACGRFLDGFDAEIEEVSAMLSTNKKIVGHLRIKPLTGTKFIGYGPDFCDYTDWVYTGDLVAQTIDGNIEILTHITDLVYDKDNNLIEHWSLERLLGRYADIKGIQVVQAYDGAPIVAVVVPKKPQCEPEAIKYDLNAMCRKNNLLEVENLAIIDEFPRINTKIQKFKIREWLRADLLQLY